MANVLVHVFLSLKVDGRDKGGGRLVNQGKIKEFSERIKDQWQESKKQKQRGKQMTFYWILSQEIDRSKDGVLKRYVFLVFLGYLRPTEDTTESTLMVHYY